MAILGPFKVNYPVAFRSGGDTTRVAFGKHIQEIERIYGILNALDSDKLSASDLKGMLDGFKPNMSFDDITGTLDMSRITGSLDISRVTGKIDASRIYGTLSNANIDANNVNGLKALIQSLVPASEGEGFGISDIQFGENGYAQFANGFLVQWGQAKRSGSSGSYYTTADTYVTSQQVSFPKVFPNACSNIFLTCSNDNDTGDTNLITLKTIDKTITNAGFTCGWHVYDNGPANSHNTNLESLKLHYLAIGY